MVTNSQTAIEPELASVYRLYAALAGDMDPESALGGKLLYAGALDQNACRLVRAANIAGAASLAGSTDFAALRQALHAGVIDFLVTSLDEALRILKNEIRLRQTVAVAVSVAPETMAEEMLDRGVLPDLLPPAFAHSDTADSTEAAFDAFLAQGARRVEVPFLSPDVKFLVFPIPAAYTQHPAAFDALLLDRLLPGDTLNRRWLRLSPRYLGPEARRLRSLACDAETASKLIEIAGSPLHF
jgi:urocanate hydratase